MSARKADGRPKAPLGATDRPLRARLLKPLVRVLNPLILTVAGRRHMALAAVVHHRGRRSGRAYATPVGAGPTTDGFVIPLTFGEAPAGAGTCGRPAGA
jgi:hypothetical protein